jgi:hypothetical protein
VDITSLQADLANSIVADCPYGDWERIVADIEIAVENDNCRLDTLSFAVIRDESGGLTNPYFEMTPKTHRAAIELYKERLQHSPRKLSGIAFEAREDGRYGFELNYEKPERLNGVFKSRKADRLANYLQNYR